LWGIKFKDRTSVVLLCAGTKYIFGLPLLWLYLLLFKQSIHHLKAACSREHPQDGEPSKNLPG
jgi:hypothetical protein